MMLAPLILLAVAAETNAFPLFPVPGLPSEQSKKACPDYRPWLTRYLRRGGSFRLDQLPPAVLEYAVQRRVGGCTIPAFVHEEQQRRR